MQDDLTHSRDFFGLERPRFFPPLPWIRSGCGGGCDLVELCSDLIGEEERLRDVNEVVQRR